MAKRPARRERLRAPAPARERVVRAHLAVLEAAVRALTPLRLRKARRAKTGR